MPSISSFILRFFDVALIVLGLTGFFLARYIYRKKKADTPLVCPLRSNCDAVITSRYSKFLGIPVEILGMCYYALIVVLHVGVLMYPEMFTILTARISMGLSSIAFLFSLYLISIQAFVLKEWCFWCLSSATLCSLIFLVTFMHAPAGVLWFLP